MFLNKIFSFQWETLNIQNPPNEPAQETEDYTGPVIVALIAFTAHRIFSYPLTRVLAISCGTFAIISLARKMCAEYSFCKKLEQYAHELSVLFPQIQMVAMALACIFCSQIPFFADLCAQVAAILAGLTHDIEIHRAIRALT